MSRPGWGGRVSVGAFAALILALTFGTAIAGDCSNEQSLRSADSETDTQITFENRSSDRRRIYWIDQNGERQLYDVLEPGDVVNQPTFSGHVWIVTDDTEKCLETFVASGSAQSVAIGAKTTGSAPVPQISPVDQFQLSGLYRLATRLNSGKKLNNDNEGELDAPSVEADWDSAKWSFEPVTGTPFVRIKNSWKSTYVVDAGGTPKAQAATAEDTTSHWTFEPVDGTPYIQFRNRETDRFLVAVNGKVSLVNELGLDQENDAEWRLDPVVSGQGDSLVSTEPERDRPVYYEALLECRNVGGLWTGSSCRRPDYLSGAIKCPRGFEYDDEAGECFWVGGHCPPWQVGHDGVCGSDLVCRGGSIAPGPRGNPACYCPPGMVIWGNYPKLTCVPSITRVVPLVVPAIVGGIAAAILNGSNGRTPLGQLFGNHKFGNGQLGNNTPPGSTAPIIPPGGSGGGNANPGNPNNPGSTGGPHNTGNGPQSGGGTPPGGGTTPGNPANPGMTCVGGTVAGGACACPPGTSPVGSGNNFTCVAGPAAPNAPCPIGQTRNSAGVCAATSSVITCTGGTVAQGVCGCPTGMTPIGSGTTFKCEAVAAPGTSPQCPRGQARNGAGVCVDAPPAKECLGGTLEFSACSCPAGKTSVQLRPSIFQCADDKKLNSSSPARKCLGGRLVGGDCKCPGGVAPIGTGSDFKCPSGATGGGTNSSSGGTPPGGSTPTADPGIQCPPPLALVNGQCVNNQGCTRAKFNTGICACDKGAKPVFSGADTVLCETNGKIKPWIPGPGSGPQCTPPKTLVNGECVDPSQSKPSGPGRSLPQHCVGGNVVNGTCTCPDNTRAHTSPNKVVCEPIVCAPPKTLVNGQCLEKSQGKTSGSGNTDPNCDTCAIKQVPQKTTPTNQPTGKSGPGTSDPNAGKLGTKQQGNTGQQNPQQGQGQHQGGSGQQNQQGNKGQQNNQGQQQGNKGQLNQQGLRQGSNVQQQGNKGQQNNKPQHQGSNGNPQQQGNKGQANAGGNLNKKPICLPPLHIDKNGRCVK